MKSGTFFCIDAHTGGNPVRVVAGGAPPLAGATMSERRQNFIAKFDWIRTGLMYEPRGHDLMSGSILMPPTRSDCDAGVLFIETSGCLPMCGHGTIGTVTVGIERGLIRPATPGLVRLDTPAGPVEAAYHLNGDRVESVRITNVPAYVHGTGLEVDCPAFGPLAVDVAYGGNFYAIIEPQDGYRDLSEISPGEIIRLSPLIRAALNRDYQFQHPEDDTIHGLSHVLWTGRPTRPEATARNAVFYGSKAIDRSPCGTGTSARMAQLHARGELANDQPFVHESIIGSLFYGRIEGTTLVAGRPAIIPSVSGSAAITGFNTIVIDEHDPYAHGFEVV